MLVLVLLSIKKSEPDSKNMCIISSLFHNLWVKPMSQNSTILVKPSVKTVLSYTFLTFSPIVDTTYNRLSESRVLIHFSDFKPLYDK